MVWRGVLVAESMSLHELHGVVQLAMGWEGIHLFEFVVRGARYAGPYLSGEPVGRALSSFRFRRNARFRYVYDMRCWWEHELRVEERLAAHAGKRYPRCIAGAGACPPEDCGGPDAYHARREDATGVDAMDDLAAVADAVERVLIHKDSSCLDEDDTRWGLERAVERLGHHARFLETTFSRGAVNRGFRAGDHRRLMHQQIC